MIYCSIGREEKKNPFNAHFGIVDVGIVDGWSSVDVDITVWERERDTERLCVVADVSAGEEECCDVLSGEADLHDTVWHMSA